MTTKQPLLVVAGPTASGKTALSVQLAKALNGEVVSADSMQMYRGMDIGTAKPTPAEMEGVLHHLIGVLDPWETFSVADYAAMARPILLDIGRRGKLPILTGGTGLYIDAIVDHIQFSPMPSDAGIRQELRQLAEAKGNGVVYALLQDCDPAIAATLHENNLGRVIRAIEVYRLTGIPISEHNRRSRAVPSPYHTCFLGLTCRDRQKLYDRINLRVDRMLEAGLEEEARRLFQGTVSPTAAQAIGYKEPRSCLEGRETVQEAAERIKKESRNYAKRQLTWFRRRDTIHWLEADTFPGGEALFREAIRIVQGEFMKSRSE